MKEKKLSQNIPSSYKEIKIGKTIYRVTSVFLGEKDLGKTLEQLAIRKAMTDIKSGTVTTAYQRKGKPNPNNGNCIALDDGEP